VLLGVASSTIAAFMQRVPARGCDHADQADRVRRRVPRKRKIAVAKLVAISQLQ